MAKRYTPIELDKTRNLRFGMVALIKIEKKLGKPFAKIDFENEMTYEEISNIIWAGLVHEDAGLTPEKVAELIDDYSDIQAALAAMGEAMQEAFGVPNEATVVPPEKVIEVGGTGTPPSVMPSSVDSCQINSGS